MREAVAGSTFQIEMPLTSQTDTKLFQVAPTIAAGDAKRSIVTSGGTVGAMTNMDNTPTVDPAGSRQVKFVLSASETTAAGDGGRINVMWVDASGAETCDQFFSVDVVASSTNTRAADIQSRLPAALVSGRIDASVGAVAANAITAAAIATDAIDADALASDAVTEIQSGLATPTNITAGTITTVTNLTNAPTNGDLTATMKASVNAEVDTGITDAALATAAALATVDGNVDAILLDTGTDGVVLSTAQMQALADIVLGRSASNADATAATHSMYELIEAILESSMSGGSWVIKKTNGTTTFNTRTLATDAAAVPVVGVS